METAQSSYAPATGVPMNEVVKCTSCSAVIDLADYKTSTNPRAPKVAWDIAHFKLCEMCLNASIIGYDQTGCKFQVPGGCTNPAHPGEKCLGHKCPLNTGTPPKRTSLLDGLGEPVKKELPITEDDIDAMYLVGYYGNTFACENVELFSRLPNGKAQVVYVYPDATFEERSAAKKYAEEHSIPLLIGGLGTCLHCGAKNVEVEEDLDTILCSKCRCALYTQMAPAKMRDESGALTAQGRAYLDGDCDANGRLINFKEASQ